MAFATLFRNLTSVLTQMAFANKFIVEEIMSKVQQGMDVMNDLESVDESDVTGDSPSMRYRRVTY